MQSQKISVVGLGFVGLTLAAVNAKKGFNTIGIDIDQEKIRKLKRGIPDFFEPKLEKFLLSSMKNKKIIFSENFESILKTDITFVTVGTPSNKKGEIELKYLSNAIDEIIKVLKNKKKSHLIVIKSTVVPTTTTNEILPKTKNYKNIQVLVNPEFLRESSAIDDLLKPHLIVIGENDKKIGQKLVDYYNLFYTKVPEIIRTDFSSAELIKYSNNAFLATKISFINSIANICQNIPNVNVRTIAYAIGKDPRIGSLFLNAGPGFGGSCLPKDLSALINFSKNLGNTNSLLTEVKTVNQKQPQKIINLMTKMNTVKKNNIISILGLSFKKNTDDVRYSVSIEIVKQLLKKKVKIKVHDPMAMKNFEKIFEKEILYSKSIKDCLKESNCCLVLTDWDIFKKIKKQDLVKYMKTPALIDTRGIFEKRNFENIKFESLGLGNN
jgi:UDPglucose 6-dehydrogenase